MPINYKKYPSNWFTEIRPRILAREKNKCKNCSLHNYSVGYYEGENWYPSAGNLYIDNIGHFGAKTYREARELANNCNDYGQIEKKHYIVIVLTIAHLDQNITNNSDENLAALCQRCHLRYDAKYRQANKLQKQGQLKLNLKQPQK